MVPKMIQSLGLQCVEIVNGKEEYRVGSFVEPGNVFTL